MSRQSHHVPHTHDIQGTIAIIILVVFVLIMMWYVQVAPLPHGVKAP